MIIVGVREVCVCCKDLDFVVEEVKDHVYPIVIVLVVVQVMVTSVGEQEMATFVLESHQEMEIDEHVLLNGTFHADSPRFLLD